MWLTFKNEWRFLYRMKAMAITSIGFFAVLVMTTVLGNLQHDHQHDSVQSAQDRVRNQWDNIESMNPHSAAHYGTYIFKEQNALNSLDDGINSVTGSVIRVEGHVQNEMVYSEASQSMFASWFGKLKPSLLLKYIIPLLLIFLTFNSISSERHGNRFKVLIMQGANFRSILLGKILAVWTYGILLLLLVVATQAVINYNSFDGNVSLRIALFSTSYALYYFIVTALTVFFAAAWRNATVALTAMLGIWIIWTLFLSNIALSTVEKWHPLPSRFEFKEAMKEDRAKGIDGHNLKDERAKALKEEILAEYGVKSLKDLPVNFDGIRMQADEEYGNQVWDKHFGGIREVTQRQKRSLQLSGLLSPFISLQNASMGFAASDNLHHQDFLYQVEQYRRVFIKELNDKHAYGGSKTGNWGWKLGPEFFETVIDFEYRPPSIASLLSRYVIDIFVLLIWSAFVIVLVRFGVPERRVV